MTNRRTLLKWISGMLGSVSAATVALPGGRFLADALRPGRKDKAIVQRVARLKDLAPGRPKQVAVTGSRRDAWTLYPDEIIGRVWLVLNAEPAQGKSPQVSAFTAVCPHLGCTVHVDSGGGHFLCPCHRAAFAFDGNRIEEQPGQRNHAPRGMDSLECRLVQTPGDDDWWVEVRYEKFEQGLTRKVQKA